MIDFMDVLGTAVGLFYVFFLTREAADDVENERWSEFAHTLAWVILILQHTGINWLTQKYGLFSLPQNNWLLEFLTWDIVYFVVIMNVLVTYCFNIYILKDKEKDILKDASK